MMREWGIVPVGLLPSSLAPIMLETASNPPMKHARSIIGARAGWARRIPNEKTVFVPAALRTLLAIVAMPEAWQRSPRSGVSYRQKSRYLPSMTMTGSQHVKNQQGETMSLQETTLHEC